MASDSEGLRPSSPPYVIVMACRKWLPIRKGYDLGGAISYVIVMACRKWLPIRKGYDTFRPEGKTIDFCRKWLPIRKGYDIFPTLSGR